MSSPPRRNDGRKGPRETSAKPHWVKKNKPLAADTSDGREWLWGVHAVEAALANPLRGGPRRLLASEERAREFARRLGSADTLETLPSAEIARALPPGAAHQGLALRLPMIEPVAVEDLAQPAEGLIVMLDQITDPQNVGAIFRSAAAFGARGIVLQDRHAPALGGALAKAAAGAVDRLPHARAVNLSRALDILADHGWRAVGLDGAASLELDAAFDGGPTVLVLGSEGEGLRRLVAERCDALARIAMPGGMESLNVSAAAAVSLYAASRARRG